MVRGELAAKLFAAFAVAFLGGCVLWVGLTREEQSVAGVSDRVREAIIGPVHSGSPTIRTLERTPPKGLPELPIATTLPRSPAPGKSTGFKNCTALREVYPKGVPILHPAYEPRHDRDSDGWACEVNSWPAGTSVPPSSGAPERFKNCTELRKVHPGGVPIGHPAYEPKHDRDKDGWACEIYGGPINSPNPVVTTTHPSPNPTTAEPSPDPTTTVPSPVPTDPEGLGR